MHAIHGADGPKLQTNSDYRYAEDFLMGVTGSKHNAEQITVKDYLSEHLHLEFSM
jgi:hypothetical protein